MIRGTRAGGPCGLRRFEHLLRRFPVAELVERRLGREGVLKPGGVREHVAHLTDDKGHHTKQPIPAVRRVTINTGGLSYTWRWVK